MTIFAVKPISAMLAGCVFLSACGGSASSLSSANPFNWFGGKDRAQEAATEAQAPADPRPLMPQIIGLKLEPASGGVIVHAVGLPPVQGWAHADLVARNEGVAIDGVLSFEFRALPSSGFQSESTQASREVTVATYVSDGALTGVNSIRVIGASNALSARP